MIGPTTTIVTRLSISALLVMLLAMTGCSGPNARSMVPATAEQNNSAAISKSIRIAEVTGGRKSTFGGAAMVSNELFKAALLETFQHAKVFRSVVTEGESDVDLQANIVSQGQKIGSLLEYRHNMIVNYNFIDRKSGNVVWRETYQSEFGSRAFAGGTRTVRSVEGTVRENLTLLLEDVQARWPSDFR
jgi:hypothetical protein